MGTMDVKKNKLTARGKAKIFEHLNTKKINKLEILNKKIGLIIKNLYILEI